MAKRTKTADRPPLRLEWIEAGSLKDNPANWRRHPPGQKKALKAVMGEVGWAGALLYNEQTRRLIDGHLRKHSVSPHTPVPVLIGRWTPGQEQTILATLDPLAALAEPDPKALEALLADVDLTGAGLADLSALLTELTGPAESQEPDGKDKAKSAKKKAAARQRKISELYSVIVECKNEREQLAFYRRMQKESRRCKLYVL